MGADRGRASAAARGVSLTQGDTMVGVARRARASALVLAVVGLVAVAGWAAGGFPESVGPGFSTASAASQDSTARPREIHVVAQKYSFAPSRIEVQENDLLKITFEAGDIPHSFTVDEYRIAKRAAPGHPAVFEFRADRAGTFPFYCALKIDGGCKDMHGELVVRARPQ